MLRLLLLLSLAGCTPYWQRTGPYVPVARVTVHDSVMGLAAACRKPPEGLYGCTLFARREDGEPFAAYVHILYNGDMDRLRCALAHELAHARGYSHPDNMAFTMDCGPNN